MVFLGLPTTPSNLRARTATDDISSMKAFRYPLYARLLAAGGTLLGPLALMSLFLERPLPYPVLLMFVLFALSGLWLSLRLRGEIRLTNEGIEFHSGEREVSIGWERVEEVVYRRVMSEVLVRGAGAEIRFNDQLDGYDQIVSAVSARVPQGARSLALEVPFTVTASLANWLVFAVLAGVGTALTAFIALTGGSGSPWGSARMLVGPAAMAVLVASRFIRSIEFGANEIVVNYLVRGPLRIERTDLVEAKLVRPLFQSNDTCLALRFKGGRRLKLGARQFNQPVAGIFAALRLGSGTF